MLSAWRELCEIVRSGTPARSGEALGVSKATTPVSVLDLATGSGVWERCPRAEIAARPRHRG